MPELKPGWTRAKFGELVRLVKDRSTDPLADGAERYVGLEHIEPGDLRIRSWGNVADGTTFTTRFRPGQVLFGKRRAYQRKVAVADFNGVCSGDIYVLESADSARLLPGLLPFICQTDSFFDHAVGTSAGSLSPRTNWTSLADYKLALPPKEEQRRISQALWSAVDHLDSLRRAHADAMLAFKVHVLHFIHDAPAPHGRVASQLGKVPRTWHVTKVVDAGEVQLGQKREPKVHTGSNIRPYLRVANVFDGRFDFSEVLKMHFPERDIAKYELRKGDILLNEGQSADLVGRSCVWNDERPGTCFQMTLLRFRPGNSVLPEFAQLFFRFCLYSGLFRRTAVQTTSMAHLTAARFSQIPFPIPSISEQRALVASTEKYERVGILLRERAQECERLIRTAIRNHLSPEVPA